ncbi:MAG: hypothetical protein ACREQF_05830, partial [Candidatus Binataceae bacterium]
GPIGPRTTLPMSGFAPSGPLVNFLGGSPVPLNANPEILRNTLALIANTLGALEARKKRKQADGK